MKKKKVSGEKKLNKSKYVRVIKFTHLTRILVSGFWATNDTECKEIIGGKNDKTPDASNWYFFLKY